MRVSRMRTADLEEILQERRKTTFEEEAKCFPVRGVPAATGSEPFEVPPLIMTNTHLAQIIVGLPDDLCGRWHRLVVVTYARGGRVFYRRLPDGKFEATLQWRNLRGTKRNTTSR